MVKNDLFEDLSICEVVVSGSLSGELAEDTYQIFCFRGGSGIFEINTLPYPYHQGDVFLLMPEDRFSVVPDLQSNMVTIHFRCKYLNKVDARYKELADLKYLLKCQQPKRTVFSFDHGGQHLVNLTVNLVLLLFRESAVHINMIWQQVLLLTNMLKNGIPEPKSTYNQKLKVQTMIDYIHENIRDPKLLRAETMAAHFRLSSVYIGKYFKKHTGMLMSDYVSRYRQQIIKERLSKGVDSYADIAVEFGLCHRNYIGKLLKADLPEK